MAKRADGAADPVGEIFRLIDDRHDELDGVMSAIWDAISFRATLSGHLEVPGADPAILAAILAWEQRVTQYQALALERALAERYPGRSQQFRNGYEAFRRDFVASKDAVREHEGHGKPS